MLQTPPSNMNGTKNYGVSSTHNLSSDIDRHHRAFLTSEGIPKEESLILLRVHTIDFLCEVPHIQKFKFRETETVLSGSVETLPGFDARKTSAAFEALAKYAHNLLEQPWRKDFHRIKTTSGFWVHNIRAHLQNAEDMLSLLGYVATEPGLLVLVHPPHPRTLMALSRDCFIASQECLLVSQIWEKLLKDIRDCPLTLKEVFEARKMLVGDMGVVFTHLQREVERRIEEVEEVKSHLRENGLLLEDNLSPPRARIVPTYVPVATLVDIVDDTSRNSTPDRDHHNSDRSSSSKSTPPSRPEAEYMETLSRINSPPSCPKSSALVNELITSPQSTLPTGTSHSQVNGTSSSKRVPQEAKTDYSVNFDRSTITNGKTAAMTKSKILLDLENYDTEPVGGNRTGILDKFWEKVPSLPNSVKKIEHFLGIDEVNRWNGTDRAGAAWDCPHCTYVNYYPPGGNVCSMCSKSRDFKLPPNN